MFRNVAAVVLGLVIGGTVTYFVQMLGNTFYTPPKGATPEEMRTAFLTAPVPVHLLVILSYACGAFFTGLVATLIRKGIELQEALIAGLILTFFTLLSLLTMSGPIWFWVAALAVQVPLCLLGYRVAARVKRRRLTI